MVAHNRISAVVCSTDLERSREFYEQKLGLTLSAETVPNHLLFETGDGTTLLVYGRPSPSLADHTQVRFWCSDVAADVSELVGRGVQFDLVEFGDFKWSSTCSQRRSASRRGSKTRTATPSHCFNLPSSTEKRHSAGRGHGRSGARATFRPRGGSGSEPR